MEFFPLQHKKKPDSSSNRSRNNRCNITQFENDNSKKDDFGQASFKKATIPISELPETSQFKPLGKEKLREAFGYKAKGEQNTEQQTIQKKENNTGLPDNIKTNAENLSGFSMNDVKVHFNSPKPENIGARAYTTGTDIYMSPGQEKYLGHEAWHVVQQKQGRVKPTVQMKTGMAVNDDAKLEKEVDVMGSRLLQNHIALQKKEENNFKNDLHSEKTVQLWKKIRKMVPGG